MRLILLLVQGPVIWRRFTIRPREAGRALVALVVVMAAALATGVMAARLSDRVPCLTIECNNYMSIYLLSI